MNRTPFLRWMFQTTVEFLENEFWKMTKIRAICCVNHVCQNDIISQSENHALFQMTKRKLGECSISLCDGTHVYTPNLTELGYFTRYDTPTALCFRAHGAIQDEAEHIPIPAFVSSRISAEQLSGFVTNQEGDVSDFQSWCEALEYLGISETLYEGFLKLAANQPLALMNAWKWRKQILSQCNCTWKDFRRTEYPDFFQSANAEFFCAYKYRYALMDPIVIPKPTCMPDNLLAIVDPKFGMLTSRAFIPGLQTADALQGVLFWTLFQKMPGFSAFWKSLWVCLEDYVAVKEEHYICCYPKNANWNILHIVLREDRAHKPESSALDFYLQTTPQYSLVPTAIACVSWKEGHSPELAPTHSSQFAPTYSFELARARDFSAGLPVKGSVDSHLILQGKLQHLRIPMPEGPMCFIRTVVFEFLSKHVMFKAPPLKECSASDSEERIFEPAEDDVESEEEEEEDE